MHPIMHYDLAKARIADLHQQAERDRMARAARLARTDGSRLLAPAHHAMALARRALAVLRGRGLQNYPPSTESHVVTTPRPPGRALS
jgi:hypothetical protein